MVPPDVGRTACGRRQDGESTHLQVNGCPQRIADWHVETPLIGTDGQIPSLCPSGVVGRWTLLSRGGAAGVWADGPWAAAGPKSHNARARRTQQWPYDRSPSSGHGCAGTHSSRRPARTWTGCLADVEATLPAW